MTVNNVSKYVYVMQSCIPIISCHISLNILQQQILFLHRNLSKQIPNSEIIAVQICLDIENNIHYQSSSIEMEFEVILTVLCVYSCMLLYYKIILTWVPCSETTHLICWRDDLMCWSGYLICWRRI